MNDSNTKIVVVALVVFLATLFIKDMVDRNMVEILRDEVKQCVEFRWEQSDSADSVMECIQEAWTWNFDWE